MTTRELILRTIGRTLDASVFLLEFNRHPQDDTLFHLLHVCADLAAGRLQPNGFSIEPHAEMEVGR